MRVPDMYRNRGSSCRVQELARAVPEPPRRAVREGEKNLHVSETIPKNLDIAF